MKTLVLRIVPVVLLLVMPLAARAQSDTDLVLRLNRAEEQVRRLTGQLEELQWRNQQLEQQLRAAGGGQSAPQAQMQPQGQPQVQQQAQQPQYQQPGQQAQPQYQPPQQTARIDTGRRSDVFDPSQNPNAPGVPRALGGTAPVIPAPGVQQGEEELPDIGAPGGRAAGAPLDLSRMGAGNDNMASIRNPSGVQQPSYQQPPYQQPEPQQQQRQSAGLAPTLPPSQTPKDEFDLGYGYVLRKDYALAEDALRGFLTRYPSDGLAPDAQYWLGESMFQRQRYRDAAEAFLKVTTSYGNAPSKGAESLLRLGQSLAALNEREAACAAFGEVTRKYPKASASVRQGVDREQKRIRC